MTTEETEQLVSLLQPFMQELYDAGMEIENVLDEGYVLAQDLVARECAHKQQPYDAIHACPLAASLLKAASEEVGMSRRQQQQMKGYERNMREDR